MVGGGGGGGGGGRGAASPQVSASSAASRVTGKLPRDSDNHRVTRKLPRDSDNRRVGHVFAALATVTPVPRRPRGWRLFACRPHPPRPSIQFVTVPVTARVSGPTVTGCDSANFKLKLQADRARARPGPGLTACAGAFQLTNTTFKLRCQCLGQPGSQGAVTVQLTRLL